jgi:hypothetical protein
MTTMMFLPPISRWTFLKLGAAFVLTVRPTSVAHVPAAPGHQVEHPRRQPGLLQDLDEVPRGERREGGGLQHDGVAADERRQNLPRRDGHREVPRRDDAAHPDRLADRHRELVAQFRGRRLAVLAAALARHEERHVDGFLDVAAGLLEHLAHLAGHVAREALLALDQQLGPPVEDLGPLRPGHEAPVLEGPRRGVDGPLGVDPRGPGELADDVVVVGGVPVLEDLAGRRRHPLAVDEVLIHRHGALVHGHGVVLSGVRSIIPRRGVV